MDLDKLLAEMDADSIARLKQALQEHGKEEPREFPTVEEFDPYIVDTMTELLAILRERGAQYGEKVLFERGEEGCYEQVRTKLLRLAHGISDDKPFRERADSWLDVAGYAVLVMSMMSYDGYLDPTRYVPTTAAPWNEE